LIGKLESLESKDISSGQQSNLDTNNIPRIFPSEYAINQSAFIVTFLVWPEVFAMGREVDKT
jgi:hypothetical protein